MFLETKNTLALPWDELIELINKVRMLDETLPDDATITTDDDYVYLKWDCGESLSGIPQ
jgi:hypothetical protein